MKKFNNIKNSKSLKKQNHFIVPIHVLKKTKSVEQMQLKNTLDDPIVEYSDGFESEEIIAHQTPQATPVVIQTNEKKRKRKRSFLPDCQIIKSVAKNNLYLEQEYKKVVSEKTNLVLKNATLTGDIFVLKNTIENAKNNLKRLTEFTKTVKKELVEQTDEFNEKDDFVGLIEDIRKGIERTIENLNYTISKTK